MATLDIRNAIVAAMGTIIDIGPVHNYERYAKNHQGLKTFYEYQNQIRGWHVRRIGRLESSPSLGRHVVKQRWRIRGYMSLDDAGQSELAFDDLLDAIVAVFRADDTLGGLVDSLIVDNQAGAQIEDSGPVIFAGVLCHSARLSLTTRHYL